MFPVKVNGLKEMANHAKSYFFRIWNAIIHLGV